MRYSVQIDRLEVGARVKFKHVDMGAATERGELEAWTYIDGHDRPSFLAVRMPGYSMQMGAFEFTTEYVPAEVKFLRVNEAVSETEFRVESILDVPVRKRRS